MEQLVIEVSAAGAVEALHSDKFDLGFLGSRSIRRQSSIVWDDMEQLWHIHYHAEEVLVQSPHLNNFAGYDEAREFEVLWLNQCRLYQVSPETPLGLEYARYLRFGNKQECFSLPDGSCIGEACMHVVK